MNLFIQPGKLFDIIICMLCCIFCFAADNTKTLPHVYNYITAATYFPVTSLENTQNIPFVSSNKPARNLYQQLKC